MVLIGLLGCCLAVCVHHQSAAVAHARGSCRSSMIGWPETLSDPGGGMQGCQHVTVATGSAHAAGTWSRSPAARRTCSALSERCNPSTALRPPGGASQPWSPF
jgi:hypothetical protein